MSRVPRTRLTSAEKKLIKDSKKSDLELAEELNVFQGVISAYRKELAAQKEEKSFKDKHKEILGRLHRKLEWRSVTEKFSEREVEFFEEKYCELVTQFNGDIHPTEEMQIVQLIQMEILINRNMATRKRIAQLVDDLNDQIVEEQAKNDPDKDLIARLHDKIISYHTTMNSTVEELNKYQQRHSSLLKDLKATRDQRLDKIESNKKDYISLIKILDDQNRRQAEERELQIMRAAAQKQKEKLSEYHTYADGSISQPILSSETIKGDNFENQENDQIPNN